MLENGEIRRSYDHFSIARELAESTQNRLLEAEVLEELAVLALAEGDEDGMQRRLEESASLYERIGTPARARRARARLAPAGVSAPPGGPAREDDDFA